MGNKPSGIGEVTRALVDHAPLLAPEHRFILIRNADHCEALSKADNVTEIPLHNPANGPGTLWFLPSIIDLDGVDLFHAPFNILPRGLTMKTVATVHDIMWLTHPKWCNPRPYGLIERHFYGHGINRALNEASAIATVSEATKQAIIEHRPHVAQRLHVTLSGVSRRFRKVAVDPAVLRDIGLKHDQNFILTAGQFAPYKNHEGAIEGFAKAFANRPDIALVMVQRRTSGIDKLVELARRLGVEDRVHFTGPVEFDTLLQLYSGALALLHPSLCEGFGNPVAEAMACGCPVITSNVSAMPEVAGGAALLVDPRACDDIARALRQVAEDSQLASRMRTKGLKRTEELSWESFARKNVEIYTKLLA
ncbi:glycosyltransferase family 4 protein [Erythrobacter sp. SCSIO 43205]|uniref:glycosyltransferase family 4 protein n=1 Tax=Erythrobacter sp. SCSIO 43205 TaxID=2779361 RepID=UPI001CA9384B|nr:glycosyltransferase family 1 protein [Erythrobacter sp. SCSIO 43205]UAB77816.1 glycosyltransferase family 4 protein [Erythrobacter sp. SCSIO 43205]